MRSKSQLLLSLVVCLLAFSVIVAQAEQGNEKKSIEYPPTRSSSETVSLGGNDKTQVFVDKGISGYGLKVYLSLTGDLVVTDANTKKTLWSVFAGGWPTKMSFQEAEDKETKAKDVLIKLEGDNNVVRYYEPKSGKEKFVTASDGKVVSSFTQPQAGIPIKPILIYAGADSGVEKEKCALIATEEELNSVREEFVAKRKSQMQRFPPMLTKIHEQQIQLMEKNKNAIIGKIDEEQFTAQMRMMEYMYNPELPKANIDFKKNLIVAVYKGKMVNCSGISIVNAVENDGIITVFLKGNYYQTFHSGLDDNYQVDTSTPYLIFALPKSSKKILIEEDVQNYIGGPPLWKAIQEFNN